MTTCFDVADYFRSRQEPDAGDRISHLKLQKLVFYAQAFHLAIFKEPLFNERIEAWDHGPVIPDLYQEFKTFRASAIPLCDRDKAEAKFTPDQLELLDDVHHVYGQFSAGALRNMTHEEDPWLDAYEDGGPSTIIPHEAMQEFYIRYVEEE